MAKPRVFISSTYYDLRYVREDLERFILGLGYEPIRHETGAIPYTREGPLEESAYREVSLCDVIVCIIGGRYGTTSSTREGSITQNELKEALAKGVQVYVFVESGVHSEFSTYQLNKDRKDTKYKFVDNPAVYEFIESIYALPQNNPITPFTTSADVCAFLLAQWAGLFQRFLQEQRRAPEINILDEMKLVAATLQQLVAYLTAERKNKDEAIKTILLANHPVYRRLASLLSVKYRVYFTNRTELDAWLSARRYDPVKKEKWDEGSLMEWVNDEVRKYIRLKHQIFDAQGKLIPFSEIDWKDDWIDIKDFPEPRAARATPPA